ncbi:IS3 family transposase [Thomasclavelia ramosa]|nr:hypothetical protein DW242_19775 [Thomasclavelia ramosa]
MYRKIFHKNKRRYGYRRITLELKNREFL